MNINLEEWEGDAPGRYEIDPTWAFFTAAPPSVVAQRQAALELIGKAVLRIRLYLGWTQRDLERSSGVDQTSISRLERGRHQGMSVYRLAAILAALRVGIVEFRLPPGPPPTSLELMLYGDGWARAERAADQRLKRPRRRRAVPVG